MSKARRSRSGKSPTARSLELLRKEGWIAAVVEKWNHHARQKVDLFGFIDIVAIDTVTGRLKAVQATSWDNISHRVAKIKGIEIALLWIEGGHSLEVQGWKKKGKKGQRQTWQVKRVELKLRDLLR